ncbi:colorectal cancer associated 2 [Hippoglossus stenolepis]|uniref:colorectal cancer associated 2 n=1 Tax=Hippoglossus stenolepis TaxID=195615 RepID=UPI001FAEF25E|nr:colorectal cancer associated 2 [Hippoglossus stenolepis]
MAASVEEGKKLKAACCSLHPDKPRVYQGVRVKTTVKELLQRHRAREANSKKLRPIGQISQGCLDLQDLCATTFANVNPSARYVDPPPPITPAEPSSCGARALQLRTAQFQVPDSSCSIQMQDDAFNQIQKQAGDMAYPSTCYSDSSSSVMNNNSNYSNCNNIGGGGYDSCLPPSHSLSLQWHYGLTPEADHYGHGMAPGSPPESRKLCSPVDHNSYSPQDSFSSSSSSCYDSPTRMESSHHGFASEHYQHCNLQDCYCLPHCWPGQQESFSAPEYTPYHNPTDYPYTCTVEENYLMRDLQIPEMCYNVL